MASLSAGHFIAIKLHLRHEFITATVIEMAGQEKGACDVGQETAEMATVKAQLGGIVASMADLREAVMSMSQKLDRLAVLEERAASQKIDVDRAYSMMRQMDQRIQQQDIKIALLEGIPQQVASIQSEMPLLKRGNGWIDRIANIVIAAVLMALLYQVLPGKPSAASPTVQTAPSK